MMVAVVIEGNEVMNGTARGTRKNLGIRRRRRSRFLRRLREPLAVPPPLHYVPR
jgi:hypothetical protein